MKRICLNYRPEPEVDRWVKGDRLIRPLVRRILRPPPRPGGLDKVFINLRLGLDRLGIPYEVNLPYARLRPDDLVGVLGRGRHCLDGYRRAEKLVAGIGLMTHPSEWPTLFSDYPVACYLQHSEWSAAVYRRYYSGPCEVWPVGIDTEAWQPPAKGTPKQFDLLIYNKLHWELPRHEAELVNPMLADLERLRVSYRVVRYGDYQPSEYRTALTSCRGAVFLSPHESQGIACEEAMAAGVPIFAWNPGASEDPERFKWGDPAIPTSSVPYFDTRCGLTFRDYAEFSDQLPTFLENIRAGTFAPRDYILENLTVEKCSKHFVDILQRYLA